MVWLTMTPAIVAATKKYQAFAPVDVLEALGSEPSLLDPEVGKPVSHGQLIDISSYLRDVAINTEVDGAGLYHLNDLLRGSRIYTAPPKPKPQQTSEYKELMARLRGEEEMRAYARMLSPETHRQQISKPFSIPRPTASAFSTSYAKEEEDDMTYADVNRQLTLIINVLVSIVCCSVAIWLVSSHWSVPKRLALSMSGSGVVAVAEVVIYAGYIRRLKEAKNEENLKKEIKTVTHTWVIEKKEKDGSLLVSAPLAKSDRSDESVRLRRAQAPPPT